MRRCRVRPALRPARAPPRPRRPADRSAASAPRRGSAGACCVGVLDGDPGLADPGRPDDGDQAGRRPVGQRGQRASSASRSTRASGKVGQRRARWVRSGWAAPNKRGPVGLRQRHGVGEQPHGGHPRGAATAFEQRDRLRAEPGAGGQDLLGEPGGIGAADGARRRRGSSPRYLTRAGPPPPFQLCHRIALRRVIVRPLFVVAQPVAATRIGCGSPSGEYVNCLRGDSQPISPRDVEISSVEPGGRGSRGGLLGVARPLAPSKARSSTRPVCSVRAESVADAARAGC